MSRHETDVKVYRYYDHRDPALRSRRCQAVCSCGWLGPERASTHDAGDDELAHRMAEVPS